VSRTDKGSDYDLWESLILTGDNETAPTWKLGQYVHATQSRATLRQSEEGRRLLLQNLELPMDSGRSHEKGSDVAPFVAWDGEGITYAQGMSQSYVLFGDSLGHKLAARELHTVDCLNLIIESEIDMPHAIHVGFAFKYDAEMILRDLPLRHWYVLRARSSVQYKGYTITYHPGRVFRVSRKQDGRRYTATIYDVWGFFQGSFVKALKGWMDADELQEIEKIEIGKAARGIFTYDQLDDFITPYWTEELRLLVKLCDRLRERMVSAGFCPSQWHGAGALATTLYKRSGTRQHIARTDRDRNDKSDKDLVTTLPIEVNEAARFAYAGGRFELFKIGHTDQKVYQYDINSAYPYAIAGLPSLRNNEWTRRISPNFDPGLFAVWRIEYDNWSTQQMYLPGPLPQRDNTGKVSFPQQVNGWYWTPEASLVANNTHARIAECWVMENNGEYPFEWVRELYIERQKRKAIGDPSEKAYKLALNSLYGKMAQRLGWHEGQPLPRFHQLEWAGWVTSYTRMMLFAAMQQAGSDLIASETDSVFSLRPLELDTGPGLGQWEITEHDWLTYLQSGTYWSNHGAKYRGFDKDSLTHNDAMHWLQQAKFNVPLVGTTTRFIGSGRGLGTPQHRTWITESRDMRPGLSGKRAHVIELCRQCAEGITPDKEMHPMICITKGGDSFPHHLPWLADKAPGIRWQELIEIEEYNADE
jgi:hypothetical protein